MGGAYIAQAVIVEESPFHQLSGWLPSCHFLCERRPTLRRCRLYSGMLV